MRTLEPRIHRTGRRPGVRLGQRSATGLAVDRGAPRTTDHPMPGGCRHWSRTSSEPGPRAPRPCHRRPSWSRLPPTTASRPSSWATSLFPCEVSDEHEFREPRHAAPRKLSCTLQRIRRQLERFGRHNNLVARFDADPDAVVPHPSDLDLATTGARGHRVEPRQVGDVHQVLAKVAAHVGTVTHACDNAKPSKGSRCKMRLLRSPASELASSVARRSRSSSPRCAPSHLHSLAPERGTTCKDLYPDVKVLMEKRRK